VRGLEQIDVFVVSGQQLAQTEQALRHAGRAGYELFVLWSGVIRGRELHVRRCHVPRQTSRKTSRGLQVRVEGRALHQLNVWLYEHEQMLAAQVHAHPTEAFHSGTDDTFPIVTSVGGLSLVVPDFARRGVLARDSAAFRLTRRGWEQVPLDVIRAAG
jgi:hypothetical protein